MKTKRIIALCAIVALIFAMFPFGMLYTNADEIESESDPWLWPVKTSSKMSRGYYNKHKGIDILPGKESSTPVLASRAGVVVAVFNNCINWSGASKKGVGCDKKGCPNTTYSTYDGKKFCNNGFGRGVVIDHGDGYVSSYGHMDNVIVSKGEYVGKGQELGYMGSRGASTGKHLHFAISKGYNSEKKWSWSHFYKCSRVNNNPYGIGSDYSCSGKWNKVSTIHYSRDYIAVNSYPAYCTLRTVGKTYMKTLPCSEKSDPSSKNVFEDGIASGTPITATRLYKNKWGNYWYYCTYNGKSGYVYSGNTEYISSRFDDITLSDVNEPEDVLPVGYRFIPSGTLNTKSNRISSVSISVSEYDYVYGSFDSQKINAYSYNIASAAASEPIPGITASLTAGIYYYELDVGLTGYYIKDGQLKETYDTRTVIFKTFTINPDCPASPITSTLLLEEPTVTDASVKTYATQTVTNGTLNDTTQIGIRLLDANNNQLVDYNETPKTYSLDTNERIINYTIGTDLEVNYTLIPNTTYKYVIYAVVDGVEYDSQVSTFTTLPAVSSNLSSTITLGTPEIKADEVKLFATQTIINGSVSDVTQSGIRIYDEEENLLKTYSKKISTLSSNYTIGTGKEVDLALERGAYYQYEVFAIVGGIEFCSDRGTFRYTEGITAEYTELYIDDVTVNSAKLAYRCDITGVKNGAVSRISFLLYNEDYDYICEAFVDESPNLSGSFYYFFNTDNPDSFGSLAPETTYYVRVCSVISGVEFISDPVEFTTPACEHVYGDWKVVSEATCSEYGEECRICSVCGSSESRDIDMLPHTYDPNDEVIENDLSPTCTRDGGYDSVVYCSVCGGVASSTHTTIEALGHDWSEWTLTKAPTQDEEGEKVRTCSRCGDQRITIPPTRNGVNISVETVTKGVYSHGSRKYYVKVFVSDTPNWSEINLSIDFNPSMLTYRGYSLSRALEEQGDKAWINVNSGNAYFNIHLKHKYDDIAGRSYSYYPFDSRGNYYDYLCVLVFDLAAGAKNYNPIRPMVNVLKDDTGNVRYTPSEGGIVPSTHIHSFGEWVLDKEPTCKEPGEQSSYCAVCDEAKKRNIDALGHDWGEWSITTAPTCTESGIETRVCLRCEETEEREIDTLGHDYVAVVTAPTCTAGGYTTYTCSRCGDNYTGDQTDPAGHAWDSGTITVAPTETTSGIMTYTCTVCDETRTEIVPALGGKIKGDPDGDGEITVIDALLALRIAAGLAPETPEMLAVCDIDGDGEITVADALRILRVAARLASPADLQ